MVTRFASIKFIDASRAVLRVSLGLGGSLHVVHILLLIFLFRLPIVWASGPYVPPTAAEKLLFARELSESTIEELERILLRDLLSADNLGSSGYGYEFRRIAIKEVAGRDSSSARQLLAHCSVYLRSSSHIPEGMAAALRGEFQLGVAIVNARENERNLTEVYEELYRAGDIRLRRSVVRELESLNSKRSRSVLRRLGADHSANRALRLLQLKNLFLFASEEEYVTGALLSAKSRIERGRSTRAEWELLRRRPGRPGFSRIRFDEASSQVLDTIESDGTRAGFVDFVRSLEEYFDRGVPTGLDEVLDQLFLKDPRAVEVLESTLIQPKWRTDYRQRAYEKLLEVKMTDQGLETAEKRLEYLLAGLESSGAGKLEFWDDAGKVKKEGAIRDAATFQKILEFGDDALPLVEAAIGRCDAETQELRCEALIELRDKIEFLRDVREEARRDVSEL